jgi:hypothetical protein
VKAVDSVRDSELDSNEIDKNGRQFEKQNEQRILILKGIVISWSQPKYQINFAHGESTMKCEFPASIKIKICDIFENAEPLIKRTS